MRTHVVRLYESPVLRVRTPEGAVDLPLDKLDSVKGYRQDAVHLRAVLERAAALERGGGEAAVVEAIRLWFFHAFGPERYERVFSTPARRESYAWHEKVFLAAREALAGARADYMEAAAGDPLLVELREERTRRIAENMAAAALDRGGNDAGDAPQEEGA